MAYPSPSDPVSALTRADGTTEAHSTDHGRVIGLWENVKHHGAKGDDATDDTAAFDAAAAAAGAGGTIYVPPGIYVLTDWVVPYMVHIKGGGRWGLRETHAGATLKASATATWVMKIVAQTEVVFGTTVSDVLIYGNNTASGVLQDPTTWGIQGVLYTNVGFYRCNTGVKIDGAGTGMQNDKTAFNHCQWNECADIGLWLNSSNAQSTTLYGGSMSGSTTAVRISGGGLIWVGGQMGTNTTSFLFDNSNAQSLMLLNFIDEASTTSLDGTSAWPSDGVFMAQCILQSTTNVKMGSVVGTSTLTANHCRFNTGSILASANDTVFIDNECVFAYGAAYTPSGTNNRRVSSVAGVTTYYGQAAGATTTASLDGIQGRFMLADASGRVGFYGTTPIVKQTGVAVTAGGIHAALVNLGLISA